MAWRQSEQGKIWQNKTTQGNTRQNKAEHGDTRHDEAKHNTVHNKAKQVKTRQINATQVKTRQTKATQDKTTSCPKASRGQRYPRPVISGSAKATCRQGSGPDRGRCPVETTFHYSSIFRIKSFSDAILCLRKIDKNLLCL